MFALLLLATVSNIGESGSRNEDTRAFPSMENVRVDNAPQGFSTGAGSVAMAENGSVYVTWADTRLGDNYHIFFSRSDDGGKTYSQDVRVDLNPNGSNNGNPELALANDRVYVGWQANHVGASWVSHIYLRNSTNGGLTFGPQVQVDDLPAGDTFEKSVPSVAAYGDNVYVAWVDERTALDWHIYFARSTDGGASFGANVRLDDLPEIAGRPDIAVDSDGTIYAVWWLPTSRTVRLTRSTDGGVSFEPSQAVGFDPLPSSSPVRIAAFSGNVYLTWEGNPGDGSGWNVYFARSDDGGATFSPPVRVDDTGLDPSYQQWPSIAVDGAGTIYVAWYDERNTRWDSDAYFARSTDGGNRFGTNWNLADAGGMGFRQGAAVPAANSGGQVAFVWLDERTDPTRLDVYAAVLPGDLLPDLTVQPEDIRLTPFPPFAPGVPVSINATIHNVGNVNATNVAVRFLDGPPPGGSPMGPDETIPLILRRGGTGQAETVWTPSAPGTYDVCVFADPDDAVNESDETNNVACRSVEVTPVELQPPTNVTTTWDGRVEVGLVWAEPAGASPDRYLIYRSSSPTGFSDLSPAAAYDSVPAPATSWSDSEPLAAADERYYLLRAADANGATVSSTSNTAGVFTGPLNVGTTVISRPLEYFPWVDYSGAELNNVSEYLTAFSANAVSYMDAWGAWQAVPGAGSPDTPLDVGRAYIVDSSAPGLFVFTGLPGSMLLYDEYAFAGFDPAWDAANVTAAVSGNDVILTFPQAAGMTPGVDYYEVYYTTSRTGFFYGSAQLVGGASVPAPAGPTVTATHWNALTAPDGELYYMVVPVSAADGRGASSYSIGVWTRTFQGHETMGLPLRPASVHAVDWYCDAIPNALGILFLRDGVWVGHFREMPAGVYDAPVEQGVGYQVTVSPNPGRYSFVGR